MVFRDVLEASGVLTCELSYTQCTSVDCLSCVVEKNGHCCSLLCVSDRTRSATSVTKLLEGLETKGVVSGFVLLPSGGPGRVPPQLRYTETDIYLTVDLEIRNSGRLRRAVPLGIG